MNSSTYSVANLSVLIWAQTSNTWSFRVILQRAWRSLVKFKYPMRGCSYLPFWFQFFELMAVKRLSASCVPFKWHSIWTIDRVSNFTEFKTTIPLRKTLNIREHLSTNTGGKASDFWKQYWEFSICDGHFDTRNVIHIGSSKQKAR